MSARLELRPYGDSGLLAGVLGHDYESRWRTTQALAAAVREAHPSWLVDLVATYDHVFVTFDPGRSDHAGVEELLDALHGSLDATSSMPDTGGRTFRVPVLFGGEAGPDLEDVAQELDLSTDVLVDRLTTKPWRVRFVASPVGTPFTDRADWDLNVPRMKEPRVAVAPGSIAVSGSQSIIYPVRSPGGWRLLGRTPLRIVDTTAAADDFVPYRAGDQLAYVPVDEDRFAELEQQGDRLEAES
jgi:KipI family sensor histidine kinase inhibitor